MNKKLMDILEYINNSQNLFTYELLYVGLCIEDRRDKEITILTFKNEYSTYCYLYGIMDAINNNLKKTN